MTAQRRPRGARGNRGLGRGLAGAAAAASAIPEVGVGEYIALYISNIVIIIIPANPPVLTGSLPVLGPYSSLAKSSLNYPSISKVKKEICNLVDTNRIC